ncbi:hypothetical protein [Ammonifex thiophilus]|uniref:Uncharacterized protein n=1 Tax=Ammonifex thiophilus TaxID=444093 RepID=A0A3D8P3G5_9THEO|nr:hypothetical protein [Ammonifex thiophilus]RDV81786.1 hypothetical protein DXX99_08780 [Ammonifex thiophilus]
MRAVATALLLLVLLVVPIAGCWKSSHPPPTGGGYTPNTAQEDRPPSSTPLRPGETGSPVYAGTAARLLCRVDAGRGGDFVVHGKLYVWGPSSRWEEKDFRRFVIVAPASASVRQALKPGGTCLLDGKFSALSGTGEPTFLAENVSPAPEQVSPAPAYRGYGWVRDPSSGRLAPLREGEALRDWVAFLRGVADSCGIRYDPESGLVGGVGTLERWSVEGAKELGQVAVRLRSAAPGRHLLPDGDRSLGELREATRTQAFVVGEALDNLLVRQADVRLEHVFRFMERAKTVGGAAPGCGPEGPATFFGYAYLPEGAEYPVFVGVRGSSFSEWMDHFRGGPLRLEAWDVVGLDPRYLSEGERSVWLWAGGTCVFDKKTGRWFFCVRSALAEPEFRETVKAISWLSERS